MTTQPTPKGAWKITFLLFLFMLVNFADKIVVGLAGVPIMTELKLEPDQFGLLGSSFFFLFSISAIVVGFIVNRIDTRWVLLALAAVWALAQFPMLGTVSFTTLLICRVVLGAGEGPAGSVAVHAIYKWFPDEKRALPTAVLSQGSAFGVILAVPALNWVIVHHSWHYAFGALGVVGLMWVAAWLVLACAAALLWWALGLPTAPLALLATAMDVWIAALIVTVVYGAVAGVLALNGRDRVSEAAPPLPDQTIETVKEDAQWVRHPTS